MKVTDKITWTLDTEGTITVSGNGKIPDYSYGNNHAAPWDDRKEDIKTLLIEEGITEIGVNAFRDCRNLRSVKLPSTVFRIHGHAFYNCTDLETIESRRSRWRYLYEDIDHTEDDTEDDTVIFGYKSFLNCPWAIRKWNYYYIQDGNLLACLTDRIEKKIPDGVHTIKKLSMTNIVADELVLPSTVTTVEALAFSGTVIKERLEFPEKIECIDPYALADCIFGSLKLPAGYAPAGMKRNKTNLQGDETLLHLQRVPDFTGKYYLGKEKIKRSKKFFRLKVMEHKLNTRKNGKLTAVYDNNFFDVGVALMQKIRRGSALIYIRHEKGSVIWIKILAMRYVSEYGSVLEEPLPSVYLMYPEFSNGWIYPWSESDTFFEPYEVLAEFPDTDGSELLEKGKLRHIDSDVINEDWYICSIEKDLAIWTYLALEALKLWHNEHPDMHIDSEDENRKKSPCRLFVDV